MESQSLLDDSVDEYTETQRPPNLYPPLQMHPPDSAINPPMGGCNEDNEDNEDELEDDEDEEVLAEQQYVEVEGQQVPAPTDFADIEIVGLSSCTSGRSCEIHDCCGKSVVVGDCLRLVRTIVFVNDKNEDAVKLVKISDGMETCTVGFVPKVWVPLKKVQRNIGQFAIVKELYSESSSAFKREKSKQNCGMASVYFLNEVNTNE